MRKSDAAYMCDYPEAKNQRQRYKVRRVWLSWTGQKCVRVGNVFHRIKHFHSSGPLRPHKGGRSRVTHKVTEPYTEPPKPTYRPPWTNGHSKARKAAIAKLRTVMTPQEIMDIFRSDYGSFVSRDVNDIL